jgi:farnesyl-diphosphate farnesyltransferase
MSGEDYFGPLLKQVSRSFYLSLRILPQSLRGPIGLAYLLARAADTIADSRLIERGIRITQLEALRSELDAPVPGRLASIVSAGTGPQRLPSERMLLERLADCFHAYYALNPLDREQVRKLLMTITDGMVHDLRVFPGENEGKLAALESLEELDRYIYAVAGCVGEFWTHLHVEHRPRFARWDVEQMSQLGVRFGKGLQMTNVLRDLSHDLRTGRCYLPRQELVMIGLSPEDLLEPANVRRLKPLLQKLLSHTLEHYEAGWAYTMAVPRREWRTRLACAWPVLIGLKTLSRVARAENLLDPSVTVKISRQEVYRLLAYSALLVGSDRGLSGFYRRLYDQAQASFASA